MDERILCEYSRAICKQRNDNKIHTKSRTGKERIQTDIRKSAGARLWLITGSQTIPRRLRRGDSLTAIKNHSIILVDESELSLHPIWQKTIIDLYSSIISSCKADKTFQLFIATHSPFLVIKSTMNA